MHIVADAGYVRERAAAWEETGVTTLLLSCRSADEVRRVAETMADSVESGTGQRNVLGRS